MSEDDLENESKLEHVISYLLIIGVIVAVLLEIIGMTLYFGAFGSLQYSQSSNVYVTGQDFFAFAVAKIESIFVTQNAVLFMTIGIIVLILTPYARAIASLGYFALKGNHIYVLITLFVLIVLTTSLALH
jgi:uncharacterized membrane protein